MEEQPKRYLDIEGEQIEIPQDIVDDNIYREYWVRKKNFDLNPHRNIEIDGKKVKLPHPGLKNVFKISSLTPKEKKEIERVSTELRKEMGSLTALLRKARGYGKGDGAHIIPGREISDTIGPTIIELLGKWHSPYEVYKILPTLGINNIKYERVLSFAKKNEDKVKSLREAIRLDYDDLSVGIKRSRLEKLNYLLNNCIQEYDKAVGARRIEYSREIRAILDQARKEVEGDELKLTIDGKIDIEATIFQSTSQQNAMKDLTILQLVIARVASRLGLPSQFLIDRLAYGFYSKHNGFRRTEDLQTKPLYPSSISYDILDLESKHNDWKSKQNSYLVEAEIVEDDGGKSLDFNKNKLKENLLKLIQQ